MPPAVERPTSVPAAAASEAKPRAELHGTELRVPELAISLDLPESWLRWHRENGKTHPNLHLSSAELATTKDVKGEWDAEFAQVTNTILPFETCVAHVGGDGWGPSSVSFADVQLRVYSSPLSPNEIAERAHERGGALIAGWGGQLSQPKHVAGWHRLRLAYVRRYQDYGATAMVDLWMRPAKDRTLTLAFMYTDRGEHAALIQQIVSSVR